MSEKYIYMFEEGKSEMKPLLGGKGANLAEMTNIGFPVLYGFTITTELCMQYYVNSKKYPLGLEEQMLEAVEKLSKDAGLGEK